MFKLITFALFFGSFVIVYAVPPPCNYVNNQGYSCNNLEPSIQYYYHIASRTCQPFMYLGCGGNGNRFPSRVQCMQKCQPGAVSIGQGTRPGNNGGIGQGVQPGSFVGIGQGARPGGSNNNGIGNGASPGGNNNNGIGSGAQPGFNNIGSGARPIIRNNMAVIGNGVGSPTAPTIGQGTNNNGIGQGTSSNNGIGQGTVNVLPRNQAVVDVFNPFHPGPVKTNGSWPVPVTPPTPTTTKDFINGYAQMCDSTFGVNIRVPTACGDRDRCLDGYQCAGSFCCPTRQTVCSLPYESGHELKEQEHVGRYAYQPSLRTCSRFSYFGADGNFNNFLTFNDCMRYCAGI